MTRLKVEAKDNKEVSQLMQSAIQAEIKRIEIGLNSTNRIIAEFEKKYGISSEKFVKDFAVGDLKGKDEEYAKWADALKLKKRMEDDLKKLKEVEIENVSIFRG